MSSPETPSPTASAAASVATEASYYKGKLVVVGGIAVGKTSLIGYLLDNRPLRDPASSVGVAYSTKTLHLPSGKSVRLDVWDTAGQERFRSVNSLYYRGAAAGVVVYDITDAASFRTAVEYWWPQLRTSGASNVLVALVGNKCDLESRRQVSREVRGHTR